ncbi:MAG: hypothetical protein JO297_14235 [Nitrososphaeraceae archaeon]|nr:hypothetical protein [Nitrososphaeraceae archaeon]
MDKVVTSKNIITSVLGLLLFTATLSIANNHNIIQHAAAQPITRTIPSGAAMSGTFSAHGSLGGFIMPASAATNITSAIRGHEGSIIGGNWSFDVSGGNLQNFKININMLGLDGKVEMAHTINGLKNPTSVITTPSASNRIFLINDNTSFKGTADITANGKPNWTDVPVVVSLINGKLLNVSINQEKTNNHFTGIPIFGIVNSLTK